jgi:hypothetical protein
MRSLREGHSKNALWSVMSVRIIQLGNHWMDWDKIWYVWYAIRCYLTIALSNIVRTVITKLQMWKVVRWTTIG